MVTDDKRFAIEDNRDIEDIREYYSQYGVMIGTYKGIDLMDLALDSIDKMVAVNSVEEEVIELNNKGFEEARSSFEV